LLFQIGMALEETRGTIVVLFGEDQRKGHESTAGLRNRCTSNRLPPMR
jgi:hypothetical protein